MKLAENYYPGKQKVMDNEIYQHYHIQIDKAFRSPGDRHPAKEHYSLTGFSYDLSEEEVEFYEKLYMPSEIYRSAEGDVLLNNYFDKKMIQNNRIGKSEKLLLDFLRADNKLLIVKAPIGWGKTVLLKYFSFYLIPNSKWLSAEVYPVYMSLDDNFNYFNGAEFTHDIIDLLYKDFLSPRLIRLTSGFSQLNNHALWNYLKEKTDEFAFLNEIETDLIESFHGQTDNDEFINEINKGRREAKKNDKFHLCAARFMIDILKKNLVLIFDNVDPLNIEINKVFLQEAIRLCENFGLRIIISMRDRTFDAIASEPEGIFKTYPIKDPISLERRNVQDYLQRRITTALHGVKTEEYTYVDVHNKRYTQENAEDVISSMLNVLINKEAVDFLDYITYHNLRQINDFVKIYLATGYIEHHALNRAVIVDRIAEDPNFQSPLWILLSSILTANYDTHFSTDCPNPLVLRNIANLFCNRKGEVNRYFIRLHILNYFARENHSTVNKFLKTYKDLFDETPNDLIDSIDHALHRLLECRLLVSPEYYKIKNGKIIDLLNELELTDTGEYYLKTLSGYFEYLAYMKDDIELPATTKIRDCIVVKDLAGRYEQVYHLLRFLYDHETRFLLNLSESQRLLYVNNFSRKEDNNPFTIVTAAEKMLRFGRDRSLDNSQFSNLLSDINHISDDYLERK